MASSKPNQSVFPCDPLEKLVDTADYRRRTIQGILESYNSNYDMLAEAVQNAVDAVEDAFLADLPGPYLIEITINLADNQISVLDTGIGMNVQQVRSAFGPSISFKNDSTLLGKRKSRGSYRGYKGVGLTYLAYGTDNVRIHSKKDGTLVKGQMKYGRAWATGERDDSAVMNEDEEASPLVSQPRGTYVSVQFSSKTRPKSLTHIAPVPSVWEAIVRSRTAAGQILLDAEPIVDIDLRLKVIDQDEREHPFSLEPSFLFPHEIEREPPFRFLDLVEYYSKHAEQAEPPRDKLRQDGLYVVWDSNRVKEELTTEQREKYAAEIEQHSPSLYAFIPYQNSVWGELNQIITGVTHRTHLYPSLIVAVNRQRLADSFEIEPSRYEKLSLNIMALVHFENARPDQGRKTVQEEVFELAKRAADRAVQYLARQRKLLRPPGEAPTPEQRQVEKDHQDWNFNVRTHATKSPLHLPPVSYLSTPLTEQDVVGLFHQLTTMGVFPGIKVYATSQIKTYDCLIKFDCDADKKGLRYKSPDDQPLGVSPYILGDSSKFESADLTLEFKNNLDALIDELDDPNKRKNFGHVDICVCWSSVSDSFPGYELEEITKTNLDERRYPGVTHLLSHNGETHVIQVIQLETIVKLCESGNLQF